MVMLVRIFAVVVLAVSLSACATASKPKQKSVERVSSTIKPVEGFRGKALGIEVEDVTASEDNQFQVIKLTLPPELADVDEVQLETPSGEPLEQPLEPLIESDSKGDATGVRVFLSKDKQWEFRLRLIDNFEN